MFRITWCAAILMLLATLEAPVARAQAVVKGTISTDSTRLPLPLADVLIEELGRGVTTNGAGEFRLDGIPLGVFTLRVRRIGFRSAVATLRIEALDSVRVEIPMVAWIPELEPILVRAEETISRRGQRILERHRSSSGRLLDYDRLRQREHLSLEDVLRDAGVRFAYGQNNRPIPLGRRGCPMLVLIDGVGVNGDLRHTPVAALEALEIFNGFSDVPIEYAAVSGACGAILLWTRAR